VSRSGAFGTPSRGLSEKDNEADLLRRDPFLYYNKAPASPSVPAIRASSSTTRPLISLTTNMTPIIQSESDFVDPRYLKLATNPYPHALEPSGGGPGRRAEKHVFDLKLLWANSHETCLAESRAKRLGLLGKQWPAPPPPEEYLVPPKPEPTPKLVRTLNIDDEWEPPAFDEPTMTVNTKAALADVYGMFNVTETMSRIHERREMPPPPPPLPTIPATPVLSKENSVMGPPSTIRVRLLHLVAVTLGFLTGCLDEEADGRYWRIYHSHARWPSNHNVSNSVHEKGTCSQPTSIHSGQGRACDTEVYTPTRGCRKGRASTSDTEIYTTA